jgi:hypothetical protein
MGSADPRKKSLSEKNGVGSSRLRWIFVKPELVQLLDAVGKEGYRIFEQLREVVDKYSAPNHLDNNWVLALESILKWSPQILAQEVARARANNHRLDKIYRSGMMAYLAKDTPQTAEVVQLPTFLYLFLEGMLYGPDQTQKTHYLSAFLVSGEYFKAEQYQARESFHAHALLYAFNRAVIRCQPVPQMESRNSNPGTLEQVRDTGVQKKTPAQAPRPATTSMNIRAEPPWGMSRSEPMLRPKTVRKNPMFGNNHGTCHHDNVADRRFGLHDGYAGAPEEMDPHDSNPPSISPSESASQQDERERRGREGNQEGRSNAGASKTGAHQAAFQGNGAIGDAANQTAPDPDPTMKSEDSQAGAPSHTSSLFRKLVARHGGKEDSKATPDHNYESKSEIEQRANDSQVGPKKEDDVTPSYVSASAREEREKVDLAGAVGKEDAGTGHEGTWKQNFLVKEQVKAVPDERVEGKPSSILDTTKLTKDLLDVHEKGQASLTGRDLMNKQGDTWTELFPEQDITPIYNLGDGNDKQGEKEDETQDYKRDENPEKKQEEPHEEHQENNQNELQNQNQEEKQEEEDEMVLTLDDLKSAVQSAVKSHITVPLAPEK